MVPRETEPAHQVALQLLDSPGYRAANTFSDFDFIAWQNDQGWIAAEAGEVKQAAAVRVEYLNRHSLVILWVFVRDDNSEAT